MINKIFFLFIQLSFLVAVYSSCTSYEKFKYITEELEIPSKIFKADFNQTWQSVQQIMKDYEIAEQNQEAGVIKTRWMDNTTEINFADSFGSSDAVKAAEFKLVINVVKGYRSTREVSKVTVYKRQFVEQDFLQGWKEIPTDGILEKVLLYRVERLIKIDNKLKRIDQVREKEQLQSF